MTMTSDASKTNMSATGASAVAVSPSSSSSQPSTPQSQPSSSKTHHHHHHPHHPSAFNSTANSSTTTLHERHRESVDLSDLPPELRAEIQRDESRFERYGGDDPVDPPPKTPQIPGAAPPPAPAPAEKKDPDLVDWDGPDDPENPQNWSRFRKWVVTWTCVILSINVTFASSAPSSAQAPIAAEFGVSHEVSYLVTSLFLVGYVFGPLFWGPGSQIVGRRPVFMLTIFAYTLFHLGQALAPNIQTLLVTRFFGGFFACAPLTNAGGVIADVWDPAGRGLATSLFTAAVFLGPVLGPIVSSFIVESHLGWRWVFWVMMMFAGACGIVSFITLPETYAPILLARKAKALRKADPAANGRLYAEHEQQDWSPMGLLNRSLFHPFKMLAYEPILLLITVYMSIIYGLLYALFQAVPIIFVRHHGFTLTQNGLVFIAVGLGTSIGSLINYLLSRHYPELIKTWRGFPPAEERLYGAMIAGPALVIGIFWLGWTGQASSVHWAVPAVALVLVGVSISLVFMSFLSYIVDTYLLYSSSAFAANTFMRSAVAAGFPLFTVQFFTGLGVGWACTLLGCVGLILAPAPFLFYRYGPAIRERSRYAPCLDLKIKKALEEEGLMVNGKPVEKKTTEKV